MDPMTTMTQCRLRKASKVGAGFAYQTAWIEQRGAKQGARVELKPSGEMWTVDMVYGVELEEEQLKENQRLARTYAKRTDI